MASWVDSVVHWVGSVVHRRRAAPRATLDSSHVLRGTLEYEALSGINGSMAADAPPNEQSALAVSAVYACVNLIAGAIASLPMHIYRRAPDGDRERDVNNDLWWVLNEEFSPRWPASAGWSFLVGSKLLHGDAFAEIIRTAGGRVAGLVPLHPNRVSVIATPDGGRLIYEIQPDPTIQAPSAAASRVRVLDQDDVLHVPGFGFNGLRGMSPLRHALRVSGRLAINAQNFSSSFLANMARPDYALKTDQTLTPAQIETLRAMLNERHGSPLNAGKPMLLMGGLDIKTLTMPLEEMQLLETRKFQVEEIARVYGVPPFMIGHTEKTTSWGTGVEAMGAGFARFALRDHLNGFQNEINRKFFRTSSRVAEFDTAELERADIKALFDAMRVAIGRAGEPGIMSVTEVRRFLNLPRKVDGDLFDPARPAMETPPA
jgi:HK97 family phage portal protein